jgi:hypothetical protein
VSLRQAVFPLVRAWRAATGQSPSIALTAASEIGRR